ncbi:MAG: hypothetical protein M3Y69_04995 [Verrucomicrobiota bacterium]|nr:hypothetical protein [Verrucomicrobiota bacterium]
MISDDLTAMQVKISSELGRRPECFVTHPAEMKAFRGMSAGDLADFAHRNGWRVVRKVGGRQLQFYHDAFEQPVDD